MHVDEARNQHGIAEVHVGATGWGAGAGGGDPAAGELDPSRSDRSGGDDRVGGQERRPGTRSLGTGAHSVSVILLRPRGASGSPPRATAMCRASSWNGMISSNGDSASGT